MGRITLEDVRKSFGQIDIIRGASLEIEDGKVKDPEGAAVGR